MTNGEKILNAFPNVTTRIFKNEGFTYVEVEQNDKWIADFDVEWWNSEYKEPKTEYWIPVSKLPIGVSIDITKEDLDRIFEQWESEDKE